MEQSLFIYFLGECIWNIHNNLKGGDIEGEIWKILVVYLCIEKWAIIEGIVIFLKICNVWKN